MKVCLIYPRFKYPQRSNHEPLGIMYIASSLREAGHDVSFVDLTFSNTLDEVKRSIKNVDLVGISSTTSLFGRAKIVLDYVKRLDPDVPCVIGGPHATVFPGDAIDKGFDFAVIGEGERTIVQLVEALKEGKPETVRGIAFRSNDGSVRTNEPKDFIQDLDSIPFPARDLIDYDKYRKSGPFSFGMMASRGCPYRCLFCKPMLDKLFGKIVRKRTPSNVLDEIEMIARDYPAPYTTFTFRDDTLGFLGLGWFEAFKEEQKKRGLKISWGGNTRVNLANYQILKKMKESGCQFLQFGVESGSQKVLDFYRKGITVAQTIKAFETCHALGIRTYAYIMLGAPNEAEEDLKLTLDLVRRLSPYNVKAFITTPAPGTDLYDYAKERGILNVTDYIKYDYSITQMPIKLKYLTQRDLARYKAKINRSVASRRFAKSVTSLKFKESPTEAILWTIFYLLRYTGLGPTIGHLIGRSNLIYGLIEKSNLLRKMFSLFSLT